MARQSLMKKKTTTPKTQLDKASYPCQSCGRELKRSDFYKSHTHTIGITPYCKRCFLKHATNEMGEIEVERFKKVLQTNDKPFLREVYTKAYQEFETSQGFLGSYLKTLSLQQYRTLTWEDSVFEVSENRTIAKEEKDGFHLPTLRNKWGRYDDEMLLMMERKFLLLSESYKSLTSLHTEALMTYVIYKVQSEVASQNNDPVAAEKWGRLASTASTAALLTPDKLSKTNENSGVDNLAELCKRIEESVDGKVPLPKYAKLPKDEADKIIWCLINYNRDIRGLPPADYEEIYEFYHTRHIEFDDDVEEGAED